MDIKQINPNAIYSPWELVEAGVLVPPSGSRNIHTVYQFILRLINAGKLEATLKEGHQKGFEVTGQAVIDYLEKKKN